MLPFATAIVLLLGLASATPPPIRHAAGETAFWYANMNHTGPHRGHTPHLEGGHLYDVFKAVRPGDGDGIQKAINEDNGGRRHGMWLASQPRVVYIPSGVYELKKTIYMNTDTILMGDPINPPVLKAAADFLGEPILVSGHDPTTLEKGELSFAVSLKNLVLDTTSVPGANAFTALYWGVAQAAQLQNVRITMGLASDGKGHSGIQLGRGSTLGLSDLRLEHGQNGIWHGEQQQVAYKNIYFYQNAVGMLVTGGSTITIMASIFDTCQIGIQHTAGKAWIALIDSKSFNSGVTLVTAGPPSFLIENFDKDTMTDIAQMAGKTLLRGARHVESFSYANTIGLNPPNGPVSPAGPQQQPRRPAALAPDGRYPAIPAPNYGDKLASDFINVKDPLQNGGLVVRGDHSRDESGALNQILVRAARLNKIAYFPFGSYRVDSTLFVPPGSRIVGEAWATISGHGPFFKHENDPKPVVSVGRRGEVGVAQMQDMRVTVSGPLPGAILLQFNMAGRVPGEVAVWNSLVTVGGTRGAAGLADGCRDPAKACKAAFIGMHFSRTSSAYVENVWNWVADHITEDYDGGASIAAKGGVLVESTRGTWLHGLGSEHWWLYQLNLRRAQNVMISLLQAETNYEQGDNAQLVAPAPWKPDAGGWGDPDFSWCAPGDRRCRMGYANFIDGGSDIYTYGSAAWAFFSGPGYQGCEALQCQQTMHWIKETPTNLRAYGLCAKDAEAVVRLGDGTRVRAQDGFLGSWPGSGGGLVGRYTP